MSREITAAKLDFLFASASAARSKKKNSRRHCFYERRMYMKEIIVDWFTFSLKPDQLAENKRDLNLAFIVDFLELGSEFKNFNNVGGRNGYPECYSYNDILIHAPAAEHYERMGYCVMMKGSGIRWYASIFKGFNFVGFLRRLVALTKTGLSLNVSRIDIAMDDKPQDGKSGILDLDTIIRKAELGEYISASRTKQTIREIVQFKGDNISGRTIYFGSRKSTSYVRIYDKAAEQGVAGHWIRVEFEFKQETAMRIVNAICMTGDDFPAYFAKVSNGYLRFIEMDDCNKSRCSVSGFWSEFLGTVERSKLSILPYKRKTLTRLLDYMVHSYAPSIYVLMRTFPPELLERVFYNNGKSRLKPKHYNMMDNPDIYDVAFSNAEKWSRETPLSVYRQLALA